MKLDPRDYEAVASRAVCLITGAEMESALDRMAQEIAERLAGADPIVLCVVNGGIVAAGQLLPRLPFQLRLEYVHLTRYRGNTQGGDLVWHRRPPEALRGEQVLIVDDILDEGVTLEAVVRACRENGAAGVFAAVLVEKDRPHRCAADFVGARVADRYVYGYGLDYRGYFRNARGVYAVADRDT